MVKNPRALARIFILNKNVPGGRRGLPGGGIGEVALASTAEIAGMVYFLLL